MNRSSAVLLVGLLGLTLAALPGGGRRSPSASSNRISANDNRRPAGSLRDGRLELRLSVVNAQWFPESDSGPSVTMQAFAEDGRAPEIPGPMIRVPEGTQIHLTIRNSLPDSGVVIHGLHSRPAGSDDVVAIPAGQ